MKKYQYDITFSIGDDAKREALDLRDFTADLEDARDRFNLAGRSAQNPKKIVRFEIGPKELCLRLESAAALDKPTYALRPFSLLLVPTEFGKRAVTNGKLFRGEFTAVVEDGEESVTPAELVKLLVEVLLAKRPEDGPLLADIEQKLVAWRKEVLA